MIFSWHSSLVRVHIIHFSYDQSFIQSHIAGTGGRVWTDLNDQDNPGSYIWSDGSRPTYTHWASGQPGNELHCSESE